MELRRFNWDVLVVQWPGTARRRGGASRRATHGDSLYTYTHVLGSGSRHTQVRVSSRRGTLVAEQMSVGTPYCAGKRVGFRDGCLELGGHEADSPPGAPLPACVNHLSALQYTINNRLWLALLRTVALSVTPPFPTRHTPLFTTHTRHTQTATSTGTTACPVPSSLEVQLLALLHAHMRARSHTHTQTPGHRLYPPPSTPTGYYQLWNRW